MTAITISLSDDDLLAARRKAAKYGFAEIEDYVRDLVTGRFREEPEESSEDYGAPEHLCVTSKEQLAKLIAEGLASPMRRITSEDFAAMRREMIERHLSKKT